MMNYKSSKKIQKQNLDDKNELALYIYKMNAYDKIKKSITKKKVLNNMTTLIVQLLMN
jgi:hypothetical protein